jgi:hypothetical protein
MQLNIDGDAGLDIPESGAIEIHHQDLLSDPVRREGKY